MMMMVVVVVVVMVMMSPTLQYSLEFFIQLVVGEFLSLLCMVFAVCTSAECILRSVALFAALRRLPASCAGCKPISY